MSNVNLRPAQANHASRIVERLRGQGGVLLVLPVGSGKTLVALSAAIRWGADRLFVVVPARLRDHWRRHLRSLGVRASILTHAWLSRRAPADLSSISPDFVIVDEAHRFRNPSTRRYRTLAALAARAPVVGLTATPVVRGFGDVEAVCALFDAEAAERCFGGGPLDPAGRRDLLARLVVQEDADRGPRSRVRTQETVATGGAELQRLISEYVRATVPEPGFHALYARLVERSVQSSPGAFRAVHEACAALIARRDEAFRAGRPLSRREYRRLFRHRVGGDGAAQAVFPWFYSPRGEALDEGPMDPAATNGERSEALAGSLLEWSRRNSASSRLLVEFDDWAPVLAYSAYASTVWWLRANLGRARCRFVDGHRYWSTASGRGRSRAFLLDAIEGCSIVCTDVLSLGVDLPWIRTVVHLEEPWTHALLVQREGRATRVPDAKLDRSVCFVSRTERGNAVHARRLEREAAADAFLARTHHEKVDGFGPLLAVRGRRSPLFHVKHAFVATQIRQRLARAGLAAPTAGTPPDEWLAHHWLEARRRRAGWCESDPRDDDLGFT